MLLQPEQVKHIIDSLPKRQHILPNYRPAAVMLIFLNKNERTQLVYTRRTTKMKVHSGNMAFPGGKIDKTDASSYATAVRETYEEIGIGESQYEYLGDLGFFETLTSRYDAAAHLSWSPEPLHYKINRDEVAEVVEIPVGVLLEQLRPDLDFNDVEHVRYLNFRYHAPDSQTETVLWGLTARITHHFLSGLLDHLL